MKSRKSEKKHANDTFSTSKSIGRDTKNTKNKVLRALLISFLGFCLNLQIQYFEKMTVFNANASQSDFAKLMALKGVAPLKSCFSCSAVGFTSK